MPKSVGKGFSSGSVPIGAVIALAMEYLLGIEKRPRYILPQKEAALVREQMCQWWLERWVRRRIEREDVLERMAKHSLVHPIRHGARIVLPQTDLEQPELFEEVRRIHPLS